MTKIARHYSHTITITKSSHYCHNKQQYYNHDNIQYNVKHLIVMQYACMLQDKSCRDNSDKS